MKAQYVSTLDYRVVQRANGTFRVQKLNPSLLRDGGRGRNDCDPWENISPPNMDQKAAFAFLRRFELDPTVTTFFTKFV